MQKCDVRYKFIRTAHQEKFQKKLHLDVYNIIQIPKQL